MRLFSLISWNQNSQNPNTFTENRIDVVRRCVPSRRASTGINTGKWIESMITFSYICFPVDTVRQTDDCSPVFLPSRLDLPALPVTPGVSQCQLPLVDERVLRLLCIHLCISSERWFSELCSLFFIMESFSDKHTSHILPPGSYLWHFFSNCHFTLSMLLPASFLSQPYPASFVLCLWLLLLASVLFS